VCAAGEGHDYAASGDYALSAGATAPSPARRPLAGLFVRTEDQATPVILNPLTLTLTFQSNEERDSVLEIGGVIAKPR
jgi:hypothetical protein